MNLPPWNTPPEERSAFTSFVIAKLEEEDDRLVRRFARRWLDRSADPDWLSNVRDQLEADRLARKHGGTITWPEDKLRRGKRKGRGPLERATRDVRRIRAIFKTYWPDKSRRTTQPSAEQIAAERWNLSDEDADTLYKRFHHNS